MNDFPLHHLSAREVLLTTNLLSVATFIIVSPRLLKPSTDLFANLNTSDVRNGGKACTLLKTELFCDDFLLY